jgi:hypothetical protein
MLSGGAIGGIIVGIFIVVVLVVLALVLFLSGKCMTSFMYTIITLILLNVMIF